MTGELFSFLILIILSFGVASITFRLVHKSLRNLLDEIVKLKDCTTFYYRVLGIGLFCVAISSALSTSFIFQKDAAFMEYVWRIASGLSGVFNTILLLLVAYLFILAIFVAVLRRRNE